MLQRLDNYKKLAATPLFKNSFYLMGSYIILGGFGFIFWIVAARLFSEQEVGISSALISITTFLVLIGLLGFDSSLVYFLPKTRDKSKLINFCFTLGILISIGAAVVFLVGLPLWAQGLLEFRFAFLFLTIILILPFITTFANMLNSTFLSYRKTQYIFIKALIFSILKILLLFPIILIAPLFGIAVSWLLALGITSVVILAFFLPKVENSYRVHPTLNLKILPRGFLNYSFGTFLIKLLTTTPELLLPLVVLNLLGAQQNAYFYIAWMFWILVSALLLSISLSLFTEGVYSPEQLKINIRRALKLAVLITVPIAIILLAAGEWLLLAFGEAYSINSCPILRILAFTTLCAILPFIYTGALKAIGKIKELVVFWGFIATSIMVGGYLVTPHLGIIGIGYILLIVYFTASVYILISRKLLQFKLPPATVAISGGFDILHQGHTRHIKEALKLGSRLIIILTRDDQLIAKKGFYVMGYEERKEVIEAVLNGQGEVVENIDKDLTSTESLRYYRPDIFAKGGDTWDKDNLPEEKVCDELGIEVVFGVGGFEKNNSSSGLAKRALSPSKRSKQDE